RFRGAAAAVASSPALALLHARHPAGVAFWDLHHVRTHHMSSPPWLGRRHETPVLNMRERFAALRNLPPYLRDIWHTSPLLAGSSLLLRLARALLPIATLYVGKLIVDEVVRLVGLGAGTQGFADMWNAGVLDHLLALLAAEFALAVASDILGRIVGMVDSLLSELYSNATSVRLMEHAASLDLEDFEDADLQDRLDRARRQVSGRSSLMSQLLGHAQDI